MSTASKKIQSQSTFATLQRLPTGAWGIKMLKQKILVGKCGLVHDQLAVEMTI